MWRKQLHIFFSIEMKKLPPLLVKNGLKDTVAPEPIGERVLVAFMLPAYI